jgi:hypothetical protein
MHGELGIVSGKAENKARIATMATICMLHLINIEKNQKEEVCSAPPN